MPTKEFKGKSVDLAIFAGLDAMGLGIDEVSIEIINDGTGGLFGMGKACVRMTPKSEMSEDELKEEEELKKKAEEEHQRERALRDGNSSKSHDRRGKRNEKRERAAEPEVPAEVETAVYEDADEPCKCEPFLTEILRIMDVDAKCKTVKSEEENVMRMVMEGADTAILIGRRGETLDALQYLTSLKVNRGKEGYTRVTLDTENYRARREDTLMRLANRMANRAVKTGRRVSLEPMNPYERRIIHSALQLNDRVDTHSEGDEPNRHVVITLKK